jgi:cytochrome c-type biogenesis protein CcmH
VKQRRSLYLVLAAISLVAAIWLSMLLLASRQQTLDQHVHNIGSQLKCPICQNESVADSPSYIAQQMRGVIRQQVQEGKSDQEIIQYFQERYGNQIVWTPQWQGFSLLAWLMPIGLMLAGLVLVWFTVRDWKALTPASGPRVLLDEDAQEQEQVEDEELGRYREQLLEELATEDPLFKGYRSEAQ